VSLADRALLVGSDHTDGSGIRWDDAKCKGTGYHFTQGYPTEIKGFERDDLRWGYLEN
jgi:hypothetical protein